MIFHFKGSKKLLALHACIRHAVNISIALRRKYYVLHRRPIHCKCTCTLCKQTFSNENQFPRHAQRTKRSCVCLCILRVYTCFDILCYCTVIITCFTCITHRASERTALLTVRPKSLYFYHPSIKKTQSCRLPNKVITKKFTLISSIFSVHFAKQT